MSEAGKLWSWCGPAVRADLDQVACDESLSGEVTAWVCLQPGCVYHVQLKAEGNDHIERALPHHRVITVSMEFFTEFSGVIASLIKNLLALLWLAFICCGGWRGVGRREGTFKS